MDSAATHNARQGRAEEYRFSKSVPVSMAKGTALAYESRGTVLFEQNIAPLVSLGRVIRLLQCGVLWTEEGFSLYHPGRGELPVRIVTDVPSISKSLALELMGSSYIRTVGTL